MINLTEQDGLGMLGSNGTGGWKEVGGARTTIGKTQPSNSDWPGQRTGGLNGVLARSGASGCVDQANRTSVVPSQALRQAFFLALPVHERSYGRERPQWVCGG